MSKAFTKEDVDPPDRSGRKRSATGLPPGATNYITANGAARLRTELGELRRAGRGPKERIKELEDALASVTVVEAPEESVTSVAFGAQVTVRDVASNLHTCRIVGVDEVDFHRNAVSWISPIGRILLAAELGERVTLPEIGPVEIVKIESPTD